MEKRNLIFLVCILVIIVVLSFIVTSYDIFSGKKTIENANFSLRETTGEGKTASLAPTKIGTVEVIRGYVKNLDIEGNKAA